MNPFFFSLLYFSFSLYIQEIIFLKRDSDSYQILEYTYNSGKNITDRQLFSHENYCVQIKFLHFSSCVFLVYPTHARPEEVDKYPIVILLLYLVHICEICKAPGLNSMTEAPVSLIITVYIQWYFGLLRWTMFSAPIKQSLMVNYIVS